LHHAGVPIGARTDQSVPGYSLHRDLEPYVKAGVTPMEAIRSATIVPASAMKLDQESATIEAGKRADLILVAGRPDRVISDIRNVKSVIAAGRAYECAERWKSVGFRPLIAKGKDIAVLKGPAALRANTVRVPVSFPPSHPTVRHLFRWMSWREGPKDSERDLRFRQTVIN
jgi:adenine deaminase